MARRLRSPAVMAAVAVAAMAAAPARAMAADVIVVDGDRAVKRSDPFVPSRVERELPPPPTGGVARAASAGSAVRAAQTARGRRAVTRVLRRAARLARISRRSYLSYARLYARARRVHRRLRGARRTQLGYVIASLERVALRGRLVPSRMPVLFLQLRRNLQYWPALRYPRSGDQVSFRGSEILFQYYPGRGLQLQPLSTFKKANLMHGACVGARPEPCRRAGLARLLDEMTRLAVRRSSRFIAWEYLFDFGGGAPPWMSGMAQASGVQALARASRLLDRPDYIATARSALGAFETGPPVGVRTTGPGGGVHYLQYSFAPSLFIFNAFMQALVGLYDFEQIAGDGRAGRLFEVAEPEGRREVPMSDTGDWSRYSYRGRKATAEYHELMRELLQSLCSRRIGEVYCTYAARYRRYQQERH